MTMKGYFHFFRSDSLIMKYKRAYEDLTARIKNIPLASIRHNIEYHKTICSEQIAEAKKSSLT